MPYRQHQHNNRVKKNESFNYVENSIMVYTTPATLHLHYDVEKPGYQGYDRRHYPEKYRLTLSDPVYKPRGRAHVPSPPLEEVQWRPHGQHIEPIYSK